MQCYWSIVNADIQNEEWSEKLLSHLKTADYGGFIVFQASEWRVQAGYYCSGLRTSLLDI